MFTILNVINCVLQVLKCYDEYANEGLSNYKVGYLHIFVQINVNIG